MQTPNIYKQIPPISFSHVSRFEDNRSRQCHLQDNLCVPGDKVKANGDKVTAQRIVDDHWSNYLVTQVIPFGFPQYKTHRFRVYLDSPHFMARQMGFSQAIPAPYSMVPEKQICQFIPNSFKEVREFMANNLLTRTFYDPIDCDPSGFVTKGHIEWWDAYYSHNRS
ncbi:hypothetical protein PIB30_042289 [Stylosanthes scabra]|uniref:Uncharacterized protein n=1 Tax=Stylosanthes scabra TaxID=79078 RepID=A0ABU6VDH6_9FABA|nr:hypothetical protein [Stylosanthes scabra]